MSNAMATLSDDEDDGLQDPIRLFHYEQNRVLKHSEINSFTIEDFGYVEEFDIHPVNCLHFDKDKQLVQKRLNCDAKPLEEYSNSNTKGQNSEIIVPTGGEATNLENQNINISANTAHVEKQLETSIMAKRSYDIHKAQPAREINFKKNIGLTGMKIVQKDIIVDDESDDNQCESSKTLKRKAYDSKVEKKNYDDVYERIISKAYQREKNNAMHFNIIKKASASVNTNNVIKKLNDGRKQLEEANMCQIRDSIVPKKIRRSKSLHISSSDSLTKCTLRNFVAAEGIKKAENVDINTSNRIKHAKIVKSKSIAAVIQTKKVITNDVTKSCSKEKHKSNETKIKHTNTNLSTKVTESHLTVSKVPLSVAKKRRNTISACKTEDKITSALKICDKKVFGCESVIPHYHRLSFDNKIEKIKGKQTNVDKRRTSLDSSKTHSLVNQETLQKNNRRDKDLYENQKGDLNTQSPSQPHLPKMRLITNYNSSTIQPINLCNNDSSPKSIPLNKPETHRKNDKNINKTGEGNIKTRSFSQSNLPLIPVPINENSGVKESLKLNISPLQVVHVHNPPQIQSEVAHTQIIDDDETNIGEINNISNECPAGNSVEKTSSAHSSGVTNSNVIKLPIKEYSSPIAPILSHSSILDILNTTDYDFPLLSKQPDNCTENDFSLLSERSDESLEHLEAERINTF
ncbi:uncharacterized protein LOC120632553 isoform X2 [Pararge aegeria]|uniref:uncharacterized protein LOC120632553 isoform X2 n=1 Tax=Pararge aegeria TaxID=116150 RepID=UPI0019D267FB|nr:uncharacterized protein LOC120632553 isoform X2 [Pararge aegeria]